MLMKGLGVGIEWHTETRLVADLQDYPHNPRTFTDKGMADLMASMKSLGYIDPIAINLDGTIIGGHARKKTLIDMGFAQVDVRVPDKQLTAKQVKEAIIRLNRNTAGAWDYKMLEDEFEQAELIQWGFEKSEFNSFGSTGNKDPDELAPIPSVAATVRGDQWLLGTHTIRCGDSTMATDVKALLGSATPHLMVTDPPYGVSYDASWRVGHDLNVGKKIGGKGQGGRSLGKVSNDNRADWSEAYALFPGDVAYIWHGGVATAIVAKGLVKTGFSLRSQIIWVKQHFVFSRGDYHWQHEPCWYAVRNGKKGHYVGGRKQTTVWEIANNNPFGNAEKEEKTGHSTQKPVECMKRPIENNSQAHDSVYEPFSGSGTTIIACEMTSRSCYAMELDPLYVDMAIIRWQKFTGKKAIHVNGQHFDDRTSLSAKKQEAEKPLVKIKGKKNANAA